MADKFKIDFNIPWVVRFHTIWKPIYEEEVNEYKLKYIEFLVFIHSVLDSNGNEINREYIESIEVVSDSPTLYYGDFTLKIPEVLFEDGKGGKDIKKFRMNNNSIEDYDTEVWNLNNNLANKTSCEYKQYYNYANFADDLYGIDGKINYDDYKQKSKKRKNAYENSLLFKIHLSGLAIEANYVYDADNDKYKESANKHTNTNKKIVYAVASNPFFLPSALFDDRSNDNAVYSFFNTDEYNVTKAFICSHDVNAHVDSNDYKIVESEEFKCFYDEGRDGVYANYNYVYAIKSLYCSGNIKLELVSPFQWHDNDFNIYQRYKNPPHEKTNEEYQNPNIEFNKLYGNSKFPDGFNIMSEEAKQIVCFHNGMEDNNSSNLTKYYSIFSNYDTSYIVNEKTNLVKKESFKERFCKNNDKYDPNKYIDCGQRKTEINFGTILWDYKRYNTLAKLEYIQKVPPLDKDKPQGVEAVYNNTWFFGGISEADTPCLLFYGMYKVESIL